MRWASPRPRLWDKRRRRFFCWWPTTLPSGHTVWLESVTVIESYEKMWPYGLEWVIQSEVVNG